MLRVPRFGYYCFIVMLACDAIAAYAVAGIPIPWFAYAFALLGLGVLSLGRTQRLRPPPGTTALLILLSYALLVQLSVGLAGTRWLMPARSPTSYDIFIASRFLVLIGFGATFLFTYSLSRRLGIYRVVKAMVLVGVAVSLMAAYIYIAQIYGLWEPTRTRMGTGGQIYANEKVAFTFGFHRALGTFREPSHLAEWLLAPAIILALTFRSLRGLMALLLVAFVLLLTGSMLGALGLAVGFFVAALASKRGFVRGGVFIGILFVATTIVLQLFSIDVVGVMVSRLHEFEELGASPRTFAYRFVLAGPVLSLGRGLGNANLVLAEGINSTLIPSHLSLYLNMWHALGLLGLIATLVLTLRPLLAHDLWNLAKSDRTLAATLGGIAAWIVAFAAHAEELTVMFAILSGIAWAAVAETASRNIVKTSTEEVHA